MLHLFLHALVPAIIALCFFPKRVAPAFVIMMLTMAVDLDHLLADPIYDPQRCSINFHPLHKPLPVLAYAAMTLHPLTRLAGLGLTSHMALDSIDCQVTNNRWYQNTAR
jgi:Family of unknown function (DUF6122)